MRQTGAQKLKRLEQRSRWKESARWDGPGVPSNASSIANDQLPAYRDLFVSFTYERHERVENEIHKRLTTWSKKWRICCLTASPSGWLNSNHSMRRSSG